ncbi:hypothetical protein [Nocardia brasiliensis]
MRRWTVSRYTLTEAGRQQAVDSAPGHVAQVRRLVFDPLTTAQRRHLGTALSRVAETVRREIAGPAQCGVHRIFRPPPWRIP